MTPITKDMIRNLRKIAKYGKGAMHQRLWFGQARWLGFDDADIQWFLTDHDHIEGPAIRSLRERYDRDMREVKRRFERGECVLPFFPFNKSQAKALLREIGK